MISLQDIARHDQSVTELAGLPVGWQAWRECKIAMETGCSSVVRRCSEAAKWVRNGKPKDP